MKKIYVLPILALLLSACSPYRPSETVRIKPYEDDNITAFARSTDGSLYWLGQKRIYAFAAREAACFEPLLAALKRQQDAGETDHSRHWPAAEATLQTETGTVGFSYNLLVPGSEAADFDNIPATAGCKVVNGWDNPYHGFNSDKTASRLINGIQGTLLPAGGLPPQVQKTALTKPQRMTFHTVRLATAEERQQKIDDHRQNRTDDVADTARDMLKLPLILPFALPALLDGGSIGSKGAGK